MRYEFERSPSALASVEASEPFCGCRGGRAHSQEGRGYPARHAHRQRQLDLLWRRRRGDPFVVDLADECGRHPDGWRVIQGRPDFFSITKKMHNALQGAEINLSELKRDIYEEVVFENAVRMHIDHDFVIVHDPQPLPLISHFRKKRPGCGAVTSISRTPNPELCVIPGAVIERYDAVDPFPARIRPESHAAAALHRCRPSTRSRQPTRSCPTNEIEDRLAHYGVPTDLPLVVQVSRFDKWKDPEGVIDAFRMARQEIDATLVLVGNVATDDPEGQQVFESLCRCREDRIHILSVQELGAGQRAAAPGHGRAAEVDPRGVRSHGSRGDVEGHAGDRRQAWVASGTRSRTASTASWSRASSRRPRGSSGSSRIPGFAAGSERRRKRRGAHALPDGAADGGLVRPGRVIRGELPVEGTP